MRDPSHDKNVPIMSVTGSIHQNIFKVKVDIQTYVNYWLSQKKVPKSSLASV